MRHVALGLLLVLAACESSPPGNVDGGDNAPGGDLDTPPAPCEQDEECDRGNVCESANCSRGFCEYEPLEEGWACDDGDACTISGACLQGVCVSQPLDCSNAGDVCNSGACDPLVGCVGEPLANGTLCDDADPCTVSDSCEAGTCVGGGAPDCTGDDGPCSRGECDPLSGGCHAVAVNEGEACDDGLFCTEATTCNAGTCSGAAVDCGSLDGACSLGVCDEDADTCMAVPAAEGEACDDGASCTDADLCGNGTCAGTPRDCGGGDACNDSVCDPGTGLCGSVPLTGPSCDDGRACTEGDSCSDGVCSGTPLSCAGVAGPCEIANCQEPSGTCVPQPIVDGTACDDGSFCSDGDSCLAGVCAGAPRDCTVAADACNTGSCDEDLQRCVATPRPDTTPCNDGLFCSVDDHCDAGSCIGGGPRQCTAVGGSCRDGGVCDETAGACAGGSPINEGLPCDDGLLCTQDDVCVAGDCAGLPTDCSASADACNDAACDEGLAACAPQARPDGNPCDDGRYCTVADACAAGVCGGAARDCGAAGGLCATGACNDTTDACESQPLANGTACTDVFACTVGDACTNGVCTGAPRNCAAFGDACNAGVCTEAAGGCEASPLANGTPCDLGACTTGAGCLAGTCAGGAPRTCDDANACTRDSCSQASGCQNAPLLIDLASPVAASSVDPAVACVVAGSGARLLVWTELHAVGGGLITGASVLIGGAAAIPATTPGIYYREITAPAALGTTTLAVDATVCGQSLTLTGNVRLTAVASNAHAEGTGGCSPADGNVRVRVIEAETGNVIAGAYVMVGQSAASSLVHDPQAWFAGGAGGSANTALTGADGRTAFYDYGDGLDAPVAVTAGAAGRAYVSVVGSQASDLILALPRLAVVPPPAFTSYSGTGPGTLNGNCTQVDVGIALPKLSIDFMSSFDLERLLSRNVCFNGGTLIGNIALPGNLWVPAQRVSTVDGFLCALLGVDTPQQTWRLDLENGTIEQLQLLFGTVATSDLLAAIDTGGLADVLAVLNLARLGFVRNEAVPSPPLSFALPGDNTYGFNVSVAYTGVPAETDVIGVNIGDYGGGNGVGELSVLGLDVHPWSETGSVVTLPNSALSAASAPPGLRRLAAVAAMYIDPDAAGRTVPIANNRREAVTTLLIRDGAGGAAPYAGGNASLTASRFLAFAGLTHTGPDEFAWTDTRNAGNAPLYSLHELVVRRDRHMPVLPCEDSPQDISSARAQWLVYKRFGLDCGADECFELPTLPASFPRAGTAGGKRDGLQARVGSGAACTATAQCNTAAGETCADPDGDGAFGCFGGGGSEANPWFSESYSWRVHAYDLELLPGAFDFDDYDFSTRETYVTHETTNEVGL